MIKETDEIYEGDLWYIRINDSPYLTLVRIDKITVNTIRTELLDNSLKTLSKRSVELVERLLPEDIEEALQEVINKSIFSKR